MKFNRILFKVFLILFTLNVSLTLVVYTFSVWSFDRSLNRYIEDQFQPRLELLATRLAERYVLLNGWDGVVHDSVALEKLIFTALVDNHLRVNPDPFKRRPPDAQPNEMPSRVHQFERNGSLPMGIVLLSVNGERILGDQGMPLGDRRIPIRVQNQIVGYLCIPPSKPLPQPILQAFSEQQRQSFLLIALGMLAVSLLGAFGIARWFCRPIGELAQGTQKLIQGDCSIRLPCRSRDEFGQLARDFNTLAQTLTDNRESRREWIVNIAHELRTPLTVMCGEIESIEDGVRQPTKEWQQRIGQKTRQLSALVNDLHQLALSDQGILVFNKLRIDLVSLIREQIDSHRVTFEHIHLHVDLECENECWMMGDVNRLCQLFGNLLQNTLRYTDMPGHLRIRIWNENNQVFLTWEDSSPGVPSAVLGRLTDRLYRGDDSRNRAAGGSGLGLSIAKAITHAHEGVMEASLSTLGGLCWTLMLPMALKVESS